MSMSQVVIVVLVLVSAAAGAAAGLRLRRRQPEPIADPDAAPAAELDALIARHAQIERALWETNLLQEAILDSANYIVISTDRRGIVRTFNRAASSWLGYKPTEIVGRASLELLHDRDEIAVQAAVLSQELGRPVETGADVFVARARAGGVDEREWTLVRRDGTRFPALLSITALRIPDGDLTGLLVVGSDVTARKQAEARAAAYLLDVEAARDRIAQQARELERARDLALDATRAKSAFLATISHEIRTPMNGIIGLTTMLLETPLAGDQHDVAKTILQSADSLLTIINDVLDFSKIEAGKLTLERAEVNLRQLTEDVIRLLGASARDKAITLEAHVAADVPTRLVGDPSRLRQVLLNLVGNAVKFTPRGHVHVDVLVREHRDRGALVEIAVSDTGIGIAADVQPRLFQAFTQADASTTRRYGGTGLGLAICRQIVELMNGAIGVESAPDRGSRFWFTVPLDLAEPAPGGGPVVALAPSAVAPARIERAASALRILLVEDNPVNQQVAVRMLRKLGHDVDIAHNGFEAVDAARRTAYDAVLMDCQMPELDGYGATLRIRAGESSSRRVPIVAVTANAAVDDRERCLAAGMDDYLAKPLRLNELARVLDQWTKPAQVA
jgi:signal transduction histidine kinase/CheY-like chemotaxis protein